MFSHFCHSFYRGAVFGENREDAKQDEVAIRGGTYSFLTILLISTCHVLYFYSYACITGLYVCVVVSWLWNYYMGRVLCDYKFLFCELDSMGVRFSISTA